MKKYLILIATALLFAACNTDEGEGGTGVIEGKVYTVLHSNDDFTLTHDTVTGAKQDVYIVYGDDTYYGDDVETGLDGTYRFQYLTPGTYTLYAYSELSTGEKVAVSKTVELSRGKTVTAPDIYIHKGKAYGTSIVYGRVYCNWFDKNGDAVDSDWALGERVYLQRQGENFYCDDVRVGDNGYFYFTGVTTGTYTVYAYAQSDDEIPYTVSTTVTVGAADSLYDAGTITIRLKA